MEKVKISTARGWAKVLGTTICIGGSLIFTFWKGGFLYKSFEERPLISIHSSKDHAVVKENWIKGSALILISHIAWSAWLILQVNNFCTSYIFKSCEHMKIMDASLCFRLWFAKSTQLAYR